MKGAVAFFLLLFGVSGCSKDKDVDQTPQLPPATQVGLNSFGCLVDGNVWLPKGSISINALSADYLGGDFFVLAQYGSLEAVRINMNSLFSTGKYVLDNTLPNHYVLYVRNAVEYNPDSSHTGMVQITRLDTIHQIIAGTFFFEAIDTSSNMVVHITDGRFDLKY